MWKNSQRIIDYMDTINGMRTFVAVVEAGSFTAAGDRMNMSVALVSKYIGQLEIRLGVRLLNRTTRSLTLTEIGTIYRERCQRVLEEFDELEDVIKDKRGSICGKLILAAPTTFGEMYLTGAIGSFLAQHPQVSVEMRLTDRFIDLADEAIDVAIRIAELPDSNIIARHLAPTRVVCCASPDYLEKHGAPRHPNELAEHSCIIDKNYREPNSWPFLVDGKRKYFRVEGRFSVNSARVVRDMALAGEGLALIPAYAIAGDIKTGKVEVLLTKYEAFNLAIHAVYLNRRHLASKTRAFVDFMAKHFSNLPNW